MGISIGSLTLANPVILAPMSGVSDLPFRRLVKRFGAGMVVSEMIASQALIRASRQSLQMATPGAEEFPLAVQLAGCEPAVMADAARLNQDLGAAVIDLNFGCPVKKIVNGHAGSALMRDEALAGRILEAVVKAVSLPVTLKMRTGWDAANRNAPALARIAEQSGIRLVTIHGRTRNQFYEGRADWPFIAEVKAAVTIPVVANGDIASPADARECLAQSGADGVMIGRGAYGRPWLLGQVAEFLATGQTPAEPPLPRQQEIVLEHYEMMLDHYGRDPGLRIARKHVGWYSKGLAGSAEFRERLNRLTEPEAVRSHILAFYDRALGQRAA
jgi:tRNA-dihydrouridine synthase B